MSSHPTNNRHTIHISEERFDSLEKKMAGIQEALTRRSSARKVRRSHSRRQQQQQIGGGSTLLRRSRKEEMRAIEKCNGWGDNTEREIEYLKMYLSEKISDVNNLNNDLHRNWKTNNMTGGTLDTEEVEQLEAKLARYHKDMINISHRLRLLVEGKESHSRWWQEYLY